MERKYTIHHIFLALMALASALPQWVGAQTTATTWQGSDPKTLKDTDTEVYLYNVGTGKFIMAGGGWGVEAMLTLQDYGVPCKIVSSGEQTLIQASVATTSNAYTMGCNVLNYSSGNSSDQTHNAILDAQPSGKFGSVTYTRSWTFEPATSANDNPTYNLKETITRSSGDNGEFYLGAVWGTNGYKGNSSTAYKDASNTTALGSVKDSANYQWRFITRQELEKVQTATSASDFGGLNSNVSYLLKDPFFDRAQTSFHDAWTVESTAGTLASGGNPRMDWTIDNNRTSLAQPESFTVLPSGTQYVTASNTGLYGTPWNEAVLRKLEAYSWPDNAYHMNNAQYEAAALEGEGSAYQTVQFTTPGQYMLTLRAYTNGQTNGYLFAQKAGDETSLVQVAIPSGTAPAQLWHKGDIYSDKVSTHTTSYNSACNDWVQVAKYLDGNTQLTVGLIFTIPDDVSSTNPATWHLGIKKEGAVINDYVDYLGTREFTIDSKTIKEQWRFHHDTTYVAFDNMQLHFLGKEAPFVFNENKTDISYMTSSLATISNTSSAYNGKQGFLNRTVYLKRNANINCWQPIVLPVSLTTEQLRQAFGDDVRLGRLAGVGKADTKSGTSIDFVSVPVVAGNENTLEAGKYYLIYATHAAGSASWTDNGTAVSGNFYVLGRHDYVPDQISASTTGQEGQKSISSSSPSFSNVISGSAWSGSADSTFYTGNLKANGTWVKTKDGTNAPVGAYYVYDGKMYRLTSAQRVKGFKWWITADGGAAAKGISFNFIDPGSGVVTYIDGVSVDIRPTYTDNAIYNLNGQCVAADASQMASLPRGIYISGGKKILKR